MRPLLLLVLAVLSASERDDACNFTGYTLKWHGCRVGGPPCRIECPLTCSKSNRRLYGTSIYSYNSHVCVAAEHDGRISSWNGAKREASVKRIPEPEFYKGSYRNGLVSEDKDGTKHERGSYIFVSPRIVENVLDIAAVQDLTRSSHRGHFSCLIHKYAWRNHAFVFESAFGNLTHVTELEWTGDAVKTPDYEYDLYSSCQIAHSLTNKIFVVSHRDEADYSPQLPTYSRSIGEDLTIILSRKVEYLPDIQKDLRYPTNIAPNCERNRCQLTFYNLSLGDEGNYVITTGDYQSRYRAAAFRLDVRECPKGRYGGQCENSCPTCLNGGICHGITGQCICAPGYNGIFCQNECPNDSFGMVCGFSCPRPGCKGIRICLPGPYGCSCYKGLSGALCNKGVLVLRPPSLIEKSEAHVAINISSPESPDYLDCHLVTRLRKAKENEWKAAGTYQFNKNIYISPLSPNTKYEVNYRIVCPGGFTTEDSPPLKFQTDCGEPLEVPTIVNIDELVQGIVRVKLKFPDKETFQCSAVNVTVMATSVTTGPLIERTSKRTVTFDTPPFTNWTVTVWLTTGENKDGPRTSMNYLSKEKEPEEVTNLDYSLDDNFRLNLIWDPPRIMNGRVRKYIVRWRHFWRHECGATVPEGYIVLDAPLSRRIFSDQLLPSSKYEFSVAASTIKPGPALVETIITQESTPAAPPQRLRLYQKHLDRLVYVWDPPSCALSNGVVRYYQVEMIPEEEWDTRDVKINVSKGLSWALQNPIPYTNYTVFVRAATNVGISEHFAIIWTLTDSSAPGPPKNVTLFSQTDSSLSLTWNAPFPPMGRLEKFVLRYKPERNLRWAVDIELLLPYLQCPASYITSFCYTIVGLKPMRTYTIEICAFNEGVSQPGKKEKINARTEESIPGPVTNFHCNGSTSRSVAVSWNRPTQANGILLHFRVNLTVIDSFSSKQLAWSYSGHVEATDNTVHVFDTGILYPATVYKVSVEAATRVGYGPAVFSNFTTLNEAPAIEVPPKVISMEDQQVVVKLTAVDFDQGPLTGYWLLVAEGNSTVLNVEAVEGYNVSQSPLQYKAAWIDASNVTTKTFNFTFGDGLWHGGFFNPPLEYGIPYRFGLAALSDFVMGDSVHHLRIGHNFTQDTYIIFRPTVPSSTIYTTFLSAFLPLLCLLIIILWIIWRKPRIYFLIREKNLYKSQSIGLKDSLENLHPAVSSKDVRDEFAMKTIQVPSSRVQVKGGLEAHASDLAALEKEYMQVSSDPMFPCTVGRRPEHIAKNRYQNKLPYDNNLVTLEALPEDPSSHYINASWMDSYTIPKKYIVTQGPKAQTIPDFWRMVWQENAAKIVMVTGLVEDNKKKCEQYWPDTYWPTEYGLMTVTLVEVKTLSECIIYTMKVQKETGDQRQVALYRFTDWPDHGVPFYASSVSRFLRLVRESEPQDTYPVIVHCSAGIGRSGVVVLVDAMVDMAEKEDAVDLKTFLGHMRRQRVGMVQTEKQYMFAYQVLVEMLCGLPNTSLLCSELESKLPGLLEASQKKGHSEIDRQFQHLAENQPTFSANETRTALLPENKDKNRNIDVLPTESTRHFLSSSTYINAVYVDGYKQKSSFLVTQVPLAHTRTDYWRMVLECNATTVILLNTMDSEHFFPSEEATTMTFPPITVTLVKKVQDSKHLQQLVFKVSNENTTKNVTVLHLVSWSPTELLPPSPMCLLTLVEKAEAVSRGRKNTTIVQCWDGVRACGIYCSAALLYYKMKHEQEVDVYWAVKCVRHSRPQFIDSKEQYLWLYKFCKAYVDTFDIYANFM